MTSGRRVVVAVVGGSGGGRRRCRDRLGDQIVAVVAQILDDDAVVDYLIQLCVPAQFLASLCILFF